MVFKEGLQAVDGPAVRYISDFSNFTHGKTIFEEKKYDRGFHLCVATNNIGDSERIAALIEPGAAYIANFDVGPGFNEPVLGPFYMMAFAKSIPQSVNPVRACADPAALAVFGHAVRFSALARAGYFPSSDRKFKISLGELQCSQSRKRVGDLGPVVYFGSIHVITRPDFWKFVIDGYDGLPEGDKAIRV